MCPDIRWLSLSNCTSARVGPPDRVFTQPSTLATLKLGCGWRNSFGPDNNLRSLLAASSTTLHHLNCRIDSPEDVDLLLGAVVEADLSLRTLSFVVRTELIFDLSTLVNACPTVDTLMIESPHPQIIREVLGGLDVGVKLRRLVVNLRASLYNSADALNSWLELPALASLEVFVLRGSRYKAFAALDEGQSVLATAAGLGVQEVILGKG